MERHIYECGPGCPVESTLQIISGKWKSVILYHLFEEEICHFGQLKRDLKDCSPRMLALQLVELEKDQIIQKRTYQKTPLKTDYILTEFGRTLEPVIVSMAKWGKYYNQLATGKISDQLE